jgi:hypothetical protein
LIWKRKEKNTTKKKRERRKGRTINVGGRRGEKGRRMRKKRKMKKRVGGTLPESLWVREHSLEITVMSARWRSGITHSCLCLWLLHCVIAHRAVTYVFSFVSLILLSCTFVITRTQQLRMSSPFMAMYTGAP